MKNQKSIASVVLTFFLANSFAWASESEVRLCQVDPNKAEMTAVTKAKKVSDMFKSGTECSLNYVGQVNYSSAWKKSILDLKIPTNFDGPLLVQFNERAEKVWEDTAQKCFEGNTEGARIALVSGKFQKGSLCDETKEELRSLKSDWHNFVKTTGIKSDSERYELLLPPFHPVLTQLMIEDLAGLAVYDGVDFSLKKSLARRTTESAKKNKLYAAMLLGFGGIFIGGPLLGKKIDQEGSGQQKVFNVATTLALVGFTGMYFKRDNNGNIEYTSVDPYKTFKADPDNENTLANSLSFLLQSTAIEPNCSKFGIQGVANGGVLQGFNESVFAAEEHLFTKKNVGSILDLSRRLNDRYATACGLKKDSVYADRWSEVVRLYRK